MLQKLQRQHEAQQQQLEKQIQLLQQQQQEMLLPPRVSGEGVSGEPGEPEGGQGSTSRLSQSSGPAAHLKDPANGVVGLEPAAPAAAGGACWWQREGSEGCSVLRASGPLWECPRLLLHNVEPLRKTNPRLRGSWRLRRGWAGGVIQSRSRGALQMGWLQPQLRAWRCQHWCWIGVGCRGGLGVVGTKRQAGG